MSPLLCPTPTRWVRSGACINKPGQKSRSMWRGGWEEREDGKQKERREDRRGEERRREGERKGDKGVRIEERERGIEVRSDE